METPLTPTECIVALGKRVRQIWAPFFEAIGHLIAKIAEFVRGWTSKPSRFDMELHILYVADGARYGDTVASRYRWLRDLITARIKRWELFGGRMQPLLLL